MYEEPEENLLNRLFQTTTLDQAIFTGEEIGEPYVTSNVIVTYLTPWDQNEPMPSPIKVHYDGHLADGTLFDLA